MSDIVESKPLETALHAVLDISPEREVEIIKILERILSTTEHVGDTLNATYNEKTINIREKMYISYTLGYFIAQLDTKRKQPKRIKT